jgi:hypothetical protein
MKKFEIGDVVRLKTDSPKRLKLIVRSIDSDRLECTSECERRRVVSHGDDFELVERPDPQADMKQAIREVLLSDEFMTTFAAAFLSATVPRSTLEHPIPGVNRPMRNEAQLSKMVELDMDNLITLCREHHFRIGHDPSGGWEPTKDEIEYAMDRCGVPASDPLQVGDAVELQSNNVWRGTKGILTNWCPIKKAFWFESLDPSRKAIRGWMKERWDDEETGTCRLVKIDHPNDSPKPDSSSEPTSKPSKTQPPSGYRMLGPAKDEPRRPDDLCWSMSDQGWVQIDRCVFQANRDDWVACRKIEVTSPSPKRYREPTLADLANGPIACEYRDSDEEHWRSGFLVHILNGAIAFLCLSDVRKLSGQWYQCRIEVTDDPT